MSWLIEKIRAFIGREVDKAIGLHVLYAHQRRGFQPENRCGVCGRVTITKTEGNSGNG
jgi:hypothetical protein